MDALRRNAVTLVGGLLVIGALAWGRLYVAEDVPNDPNIGAGLILLVGLVMVFVGSVLAWSRQRETPPPPAGE